MLTFPDSSVETEYTDPNGSLWEFNGTGWVRQCDCDGSGGGSGGDSDDPYWNEVSLLLKFDGVPSGTTDQWVDSTGKQTVTGHNGVSVTQNQAKHGDGSAWYQGSQNSPLQHYLSVAQNDALTLNAPFTAELWYRNDNVPGSSGSNLCSLLTSWGNGTSSWMFRGSGSEIQVHIGNGSSASFNFTTSGANIQPKVWHHAALTWDGSVYRMFVDGFLRGNYNSTQAPHASNKVLIGMQEAGSGNLQSGFFGHIDDVRITKGVARYTDDFTPPASFHQRFGLYKTQRR